MFNNLTDYIDLPQSSGSNELFQEILEEIRSTKSTSSPISTPTVTSSSPSGEYSRSRAIGYRNICRTNIQLGRRAVEAIKLKPFPIGTEICTCSTCQGRYHKIKVTPISPEETEEKCLYTIYLRLGMAMLKEIIPPPTQGTLAWLQGKCIVQ